ncbi:hypothetical protein TSOC_007461 [Tetrabaena socialis]|uniref:Uncharacterized protein n=1 Tax=Tetrabaena socialis TaxID=47790 RepID=A0A2J8A0Z1_9CHLO|nr:hypothetical protein TSOC_007461 [Tetrabaena socialis]|eukprot:PNH06192.1 hypothetical protein TSOC_007461 [Tetrabaena socialis]
MAGCRMYALCALLAIACALRCAAASGLATRRLAMGNTTMASMSNLTGTPLTSADGKKKYIIASKSMARKAYPWCATATTTSYFLKPTISTVAATADYNEYAFKMDEDFGLCKEVLTKKGKATQVPTKCITPFYSFMIALSDECHHAIMSVNTVQMFAVQDVADAKPVEMYCHAHKGHDTGVPLLKYLIKPDYLTPSSAPGAKRSFVITVRINKRADKMCQNLATLCGGNTCMVALSDEEYDTCTAAKVCKNIEVNDALDRIRDVLRENRKLCEVQSAEANEELEVLMRIWSHSIARGFKAGGVPMIPGLATRRLAMGNMTMASMSNLTGTALTSADGKKKYIVASKSMARKAYPWCATATTTSYFLKPTISTVAATADYNEYAFKMDEDFGLCKEVLTKKGKATQVPTKCITPFYSFMIALSDECHHAIMSVNTVQMFAVQDVADAKPVEMYCHAHKGHDTGVPLLKYLIKPDYLTPSSAPGAKRSFVITVRINKRADKMCQNLATLCGGNTCMVALSDEEYDTCPAYYSRMA